MSHFMFNQGGGEIPVPGNDAFTKILLHFDGTNGSTTFTDSNAGGVSAAWSAINSAALTTAKHKYGSASYQGAATSYIKSNQNSAYNAGSSDFTVDFWINGSSSLATTLQYLAGFGNASLSADIGWSVYYDTSKLLRFNFQNSGGPTAVAVTAATSIMDGAWHHIACVKTSAMKVYIDGIDATSSASAPSGSMRSGASYEMNVGRIATSGATQCCQSSIDEFRYSVGIARWTSNFTPPTGPYN
jgi:hypothetical protein